MSLKFPDSNSLELSVIRALKENGGSATTSEIDRFVIKDLMLTIDQVSQIRSGNRSEIQYRLAWVRTKAKKKGLIERTLNRTWRLSQQS